MKGTLVSSEFWKRIGGKMLEESNTRVNMVEKGGKGLRGLLKGERIKFYLDGLDHRFEVIEGLNHAVNFGIEFFRQQEVSISCKEKEVKLVTRSKGQERLMRLCSAYGKPFPFMIIRMPFGLSNAGSVYSRMVDLALAHLPVEYWLSYLDNILKYSIDTWDHLKHLTSIMEAHMKAGTPA